MKYFFVSGCRSIKQFPCKLNNIFFRQASFFQSNSFPCAETPGGFAARRLTALVAGELADYALGLRHRPHAAGDPSGPKATRTSAFVSGGLACYEATLQNLPG